jgi:hypothetical protein
MSGAGETELQLQRRRYNCILNFQDIYTFTLKQSIPVFLGIAYGFLKQSIPSFFVLFSKLVFYFLTASCYCKYSL